jgi:hypothetical protein
MSGTLVKGWLFNTTRYVVANFRRAEARRKATWIEFCARAQRFIVGRRPHIFAKVKSPEILASFPLSPHDICWKIS